MRNSIVHNTFTKLYEDHKVKYHAEYYQNLLSKKYIDYDDDPEIFNVNLQS